MSTDLSAPSKPAARLWKHRPFLHYFASRSLSEFSYQIAAVAVGWQIYALTHTIYVALAVLGVANAFDSPASATRSAVDETVSDAAPGRSSRWGDSALRCLHKTSRSVMNTLLPFSW